MGFGIIKKRTFNFWERVFRREIGLYFSEIYCFQIFDFDIGQFELCTT